MRRPIRTQTKETIPLNREKYEKGMAVRREVLGDEYVDKALAGATDVVGAIVVDFRQMDTFVEIVVFAMAGLAVFALLRSGAAVAAFT